MNNPQQVFDNLLQDNQCYLAPGAYDGLSARLVEQAGFNMVYASGGAIARSFGVPDIGLLSFTEVANRMEQMLDVLKIPVIADADTGFGNAVNLRRTVQHFSRIGLAALHIEDQTFPKRCGHLAGKSLVSTAEMTQKIVVAAEVKQTMCLIARTDAIAIEGIEGAIERSQAYAEAGADMIFVEAPESVAQIERIAREVSMPKLINMFYGGKTPMIPKADLASMGYKIIIVPSDLQRAAILAQQQVLKALYQDGDSQALHAQLVSFQEREHIVQTSTYLNLGHSHSK